MALSWSKGIRDFVAVHGSYKRALEGGRLEIRTGSAPATADAAATGTLLCTVSKASGTKGDEIQGKGCVTLSGSGGSVDGITVGGVEILGKVIAWDTDLATTAALVAQQINAYQPKDGPKYMATSLAAVIKIEALFGRGTNGTGAAVVSSVTTMTKADVNMHGTAGVGTYGTNGLEFGGSTSGIIGKGTAAWSGVNVATGVAGYFRILGPIADGGTAGTREMRVQGVCGISSGDYPMTTTTLTSGQTHTVDAFTLTLPAA